MEEVDQAGAAVNEAKEGSYMNVRGAKKYCENFKNAQVAQRYGVALREESVSKLAHRRDAETQRGARSR